MVPSRKRKERSFLPTTNLEFGETSQNNPNIPFNEIQIEENLYNQSLLELEDDYLFDSNSSREEDSLEGYNNYNYSNEKEEMIVPQVYTQHGFNDQSRELFYHFNQKKFENSQKNNIFSNNNSPIKIKTEISTNDDSLLQNTGSLLTQEISTTDDLMDIDNVEQDDSQLIEFEDSNISTFPDLHNYFQNSIEQKNEYIFPNQILGKGSGTKNDPIDLDEDDEEENLQQQRHEVNNNPKNFFRENKSGYEYDSSRSFDKIMHEDFINLPESVINFYKNKYSGIEEEYDDDDESEDILMSDKKKGFFFEWQIECLKLCGNTNYSLVYSVPTSGGKTLVSEILLLQTLLMRKDKIALFIVPFNSIVSEKITTLTDLCNCIGVKVSDKVRDFQKRAKLQKKRRMIDEVEGPRVLIGTFEKANSLVNYLLEKKCLKEILSCVIVDEIHMIGNTDRGSTLELLISKIKYCNANANLNERIRIIGMSATVRNVKEIAKWIDKDGKVYINEKRPIDLKEGYCSDGKTCFFFNKTQYDIDSLSGLTQLNPNKKFDDKYWQKKQVFMSKEIGEIINGNEYTERIKSVPKFNKCSIFPLVFEVIKDNYAVVIFCYSRKRTKTLSSDISFMIYHILFQQSVNLLEEETKGEFFQNFRESYNYYIPEKKISENEGSEHLNKIKLELIIPLKTHYDNNCMNENTELICLLRLGIGYHHAGMKKFEKEIVEKGFSLKLIKILCCTTTLSAGVNLPARRVIFDGSGTVKNVIQYKQAAGRAGRLGLDDYGESIIFNKKKNLEIRKFITKSIEEVQSRFCTTEIISGGILSSIASSLCKNESEMIKFIKQTFFYVGFTTDKSMFPTQEDIDEGIRKNLNRALKTLFEKNLIKTVENEIEEELEDLDLLRSLEDFLNDRKTEDEKKIEDVVNGETDTTEDKIFVCTKLGKAVYSSGININNGLVLMENLEKCLNNINLKSDLNIIYVLCPFDMTIIRGVDLNFFYQNLVTKLKERKEIARKQKRLQICKRIEMSMKYSESKKDMKKERNNQLELFEAKFRKEYVDEIDVVMENFNLGRSICEELVYLANESDWRNNQQGSCVAQFRVRFHRFCISLIINDIVNEEPPAQIIEKYGKFAKLSYGDIEKLKREAKLNAKRVVNFCTVMGGEYARLTNIIKNFEKRFKLGVKQELLDLMKINEDITASEARMLFRNGFRSPEKLSEADVVKVKLILMASKIQRDFVNRDDESYGKKRIMLFGPDKEKYYERRARGFIDDSKNLVLMEEEKNENMENLENLRKMEEEGKKNSIGMTLSCKTPVKSYVSDDFNNIVATIGKSPHLFKKNSQEIVTQFSQYFQNESDEIMLDNPTCFELITDRNQQIVGRGGSPKRNSLFKRKEGGKFVYRQYLVKNEKGIYAMCNICEKKKIREIAIDFDCSDNIGSDAPPIRGVCIKYLCVLLRNVLFLIELKRKKSDGEFEITTKQILKALKDFILENKKISKISFKMKRLMTIMTIIMQEAGICNEIDIVPFHDPVVLLFMTNPRDYHNEHFQVQDLVDSTFGGEGNMVPGYFPEINGNLDTSLVSMKKRAIISLVCCGVLRDLCKRKMVYDVYCALEKPVLKVLSNMQSVGIFVNTKMRSNLWKKCDIGMKRIEKKIFGICKKLNISFDHTGLNKPAYVFKLLFSNQGFRFVHPLDKTDENGEIISGKGTGKKVLEELKSQDKFGVAREIMYWRKLEILRGKLNTSILQRVVRFDNQERYYIMWNQCNSGTGRITSPFTSTTKRFEYRKENFNERACFGAKEGFLILSFDFCQLEARIMAHLSGDKEMLRIFNEDKEDFFLVVAKEMFSKDKFTKENRMIAKEIFYSVLYGCGDKSLHQKLNSVKRLSMNEAIGLKAKFLEKFCGLREYRERYLSENENSQQGDISVKSIWGRKRFFSSSQSEKKKVYYKGDLKRVAFNSMVQTSASDIFKMSIISVSKKLKEKFGSMCSDENRNEAVWKLVVLLHDEIVIECKNENCKQVMMMVKNEMENVGEKNFEKSEKLKVKLKVRVQRGKNWGDLKPVVI